MIPPERDGSIQNPRRWFRVGYSTGTTIYTFANFVREVNENIDANPAEGDVDDYHVYMWDNLWSHTNALIYNVVENWPGDRAKEIILRSPYQPKFDPTEYFFVNF